MQLTAYIDPVHKETMHGTSPYLFQLRCFFKWRVTFTNNATEIVIILKKKLTRVHKILDISSPTQSV